MVAAAAAARLRNKQRELSCSLLPLFIGREYCAATPVEKGTGNEHRIRQQIHACELRPHSLGIDVAFLNHIFLISA